MPQNFAQRLEQYSLKRPQVVLIISAQQNGGEDEIAIYKGFSSSLMSPTSFDPDIPILSEDAIITNINLVKSPYNPNTPVYIQKGLSVEEMEKLMTDLGI
ncbi:MAG: hypothetical protein AAF208_14630 [Cyanobacteria bacterium P01_A01_bin.45]